MSVLLSGVVFTAEPSNQFFALEGGNGYLEWRYTLGNRYLRRLERLFYNSGFAGVVKV